MPNAPQGPFDGIDLETLFFRHAMNGERFPPQLALRITASLCGRIHAAHARKGEGDSLLSTVHGSIALPIIMVGRDGSVQVLKLPPGMCLQQSPEQAAGFPATFKSDIFNAGLVLYILLTGDHPLMKESEAASRDATMVAEFPPPSTVEHLSAWFDPLVLRALARDPAERYPDARAMQAALEQALEAPGMGATTEDLAKFVDALVPHSASPRRELDQAGHEALYQLAERIARQVHRSDARALEATAGLRAPDPSPPRPKVQVDCFFLDDADAPAAAQSAEVKELYRELEALGFTRLGVKCEVNKANGHRTPSICFGSVQHKAFASIFFSFDVVPCLYFISHFQDDSVVLTARYRRETHRKPRCVLSGYPRESVAKVLEAHHAEVAAFVARGAVLGTDWGREERLRSTHAYYENDDTR